MYLFTIFMDELLCDCVYSCMCVCSVLVRTIISTLDEWFFVFWGEIGKKGSCYVCDCVMYVFVLD